MKIYPVSEPDFQLLIRFLDLAVKAGGLTVVQTAASLQQHLDAIVPVEADEPPTSE